MGSMKPNFIRHTTASWLSIRHRCRFKPSLLPSVATAVLITLFLLLSHWQWSKANHRSAVSLQIADFTRQAKQSPLTLPALLQAYQALGQGISDAPITISGTLQTSPLIIWDNRIHQGLSGYHLIALLKTAQSTSLLPINLGWHPLINQRRNEVPQLTLPSQPLQLSGSLFVPHPNRFVLNDSIIETHNAQGTPSLLIQRFDATQLSDTLQQPILPFIVRATSIDPEIHTPSSPLVREWPTRGEIGISADKHLGYALQWLSFAVILLSLYIGLNLDILPANSTTPPLR